MLTCSTDSRSWSCVWQRGPALYLVPADELRTCLGLATPNTHEEADHGQAKPGWVPVHENTSPSFGLVQIIWLQPMPVGVRLLLV